MALTLLQRQATFALTFAAIQDLRNAEYLAATYRIGATFSNGTDPVVVSASLVTSIKSFRTSTDSQFTLGGTAYDNALDAEYLARLGVGIP